jgi:hypothetical protein
MKFQNSLAAFPKALSRLGLYLFAFSIPISFVPAEFAIVLAFLGWLFEGIFNKHWQYSSAKVFVPIIFYIGWNILASGLSPRPWHSLGD